MESALEFDTTHKYGHECTRQELLCFAGNIRKKRQFDDTVIFMQHLHHDTMM